MQCIRFLYFVLKKNVNKYEELNYLELPQIANVWYILVFIKFVLNNLFDICTF